MKWRLAAIIALASLPAAAQIADRPLSSPGVDGMGVTSASASSGTPFIPQGCLLIDGSTTDCLLISGSTTNALLIK